MTITEKISTGTNIVLLIVALVIAYSMFGDRVSNAPRNSEAVNRISDWHSLAASGHTWRASTGSSVTLIQFSDFQCPFCAELAVALDSLLKVRSDVEVVYRHLPLESIHSLARVAAVASECASVQGRFKPFHDQLFKHQDLIGILSWRALGDSAGVPDTDALEQCILNDEYAARVDEDVEIAESLGFGATPMIIINGNVYEGTLSVATLNGLIDQQLDEQGSQ